MQDRIYHETQLLEYVEWISTSDARTDINPYPKTITLQISYFPLKYSRTKKVDQEGST